MIETHFVISTSNKNSTNTNDLNLQQMETINNILQNVSFSSFVYTPSKITYNLKTITFVSNDRVAGDKNTCLEGLMDSYAHNEKLMKKALDFNNAPYKLKQEQVKYERENNKYFNLSLISKDYPSLINKKQILNNIIKCVMFKLMNNQFIVIKTDTYTYEQLFIPVFEYFKSIQPIPNPVSIPILTNLTNVTNEKNTLCFSEKTKAKKIEEKIVQTNIKLLENIWDDEF
jgi:hypothetical protein